MLYPYNFPSLFTIVLTAPTLLEYRDYEDLVVNFNPTDGSGFTTDAPTPGSPVPEPATIMFFGLGLLAFAGLGRKKLHR